MSNSDFEEYELHEPEESDPVVENVLHFEPSTKVQNKARVDCRRSLEDLLEERRLRADLADYRDWDEDRLPA